MPLPPAHARRVLAVAGIAALALSGCSLPNPFDNATSVTSTPLATDQKVPQGQEALSTMGGAGVPPARGISGAGDLCRAVRD